MTNQEDEKAARDFAEKQYPGRVTMFVDSSSFPCLGADSCAELESQVKMKPGHTSVTIENKFMHEACCLAYLAALKAERERIWKEILTVGDDNDKTYVMAWNLKRIIFGDSND